MVTPPYITSEETMIASASTIFQLESTCDFKQNYVWTHSERFQCEKYSQKILRRDYAEGKCYSVGTGSLESFPQAGRKHNTNGARVYSVLAINSPQELLLPNTYRHLQCQEGGLNHNDLRRDDVTAESLQQVKDAEPETTQEYSHWYNLDYLFKRLDNY